MLLRKTCQRFIGLEKKATRYPRVFLTYLIIEYTCKHVFFIIKTINSYALPEQREGKTHKGGIVATELPPIRHTATYQSP
jgi:hypothetical protein